MKRFIKANITEISGLLALIGADLYLRLWHIKSLFYWILDYDEGAHSIGGLFITQGKIPYQDFTLVHPPLYDLSLAGIYRIFGYDFFYGRYFSVFLSVLSVVLIYFIARKLWGKPAGFLAGALLVFMPGLFHLWYRAVQEPLGIFLTLASLWFLTDYVKAGEGKVWKFILAGVFAGLAISVKLTFALGLVAIILVIFIHNYRKCLKPILYYAAGAVFGFLVVCGYFLISSPQEFISQTLTSQASYRVSEFGTGLFSAYRQIQTDAPYLQGTAISVAIPFVMAAVLLVLCIWRRKSLLIWAVPLLVTSLLCLIYNPIEVRFMVIPFIFVILGVSSIWDKLAMPNRLKYNWPLLKAAGCGALVILCLLATLFMMGNYNWVDSGESTYEIETYQETISHLETVNTDNAPVYSTNPIIYALDADLNMPAELDNFGLLEVLDWEVSRIVGNPKYIVVDAAAKLFAFTGHGRFQELLIYIASLPGEFTNIAPPAEYEISILNMSVIELY